MTLTVAEAAFMANALREAARRVDDAVPTVAAYDPGLAEMMREAAGQYRMRADEIEGVAVEVKP